MEGVSESQVNELQTAVHGIWIARFVFVANFAIVMYEYGIMLREERAVNWQGKLSPIKTLFYLNRYFPLASSTFMLIVFTVIKASSEKLCLRGEIAAGVMCTIQYSIAQFVLAIRSYAVWERRRAIGILIFSVLTASQISSFYFSVSYVKSSMSRDIGLLSPGCIVLGLENVNLSYNLAALLVLESLWVILLTAKAIWYCRRTMTFDEFRTSRSLLRTMVQDGIAYSAFILTVTTVNFIANKFVDELVQPIFVILQATLQNILVVRLLIHIRKMDKNAESTTQPSNMRLSRISFTTPLESIAN